VKLRDTVTGIVERSARMRVEAGASMTDRGTNEREGNGMEASARSRCDGLVLRQAEPLNLEGRFAALDGRITPSRLFYVRNHFPVPEIDAGKFRLNVDGAVEREVCLALGELRGLPAVTAAATLECAGNGRVYLDPAVGGVQWELGAVGTAEWTGVRLTEVLGMAGVQGGSGEIVLEGADRGTVAGATGSIPYARGIPWEDADRVLLAYAMNGEPLAREHGFPLRAIVSGHYAMAAVKWLTRIHVEAEAFQGYFQTLDYAYWDRSGRGTVRRPLRRMALKSSIARPEAGTVVAAGSAVTIAGAAWSGGPEVERVEVSTDGGRTWGRAEMLDLAEAGVWRRWQFAWRVPAPGEYVLLSRAIDAAGRVQPRERDAQWGTYVIHHVVPVKVRAQ
jgi:DMSO/TMAO reductase YedYZ molybdopterin-dependent catalytic subunit